MARSNSGNSCNLKPLRSTDEARALGKKGGIASGVARRGRKTFKDELIALLSVVEPGSNETVNARISNAMIVAALKGDVKAFTAIRDTVGEKPTDKAEVDAALEIVMSCKLKEYGI